MSINIMMNVHGCIVDMHTLFWMHLMCVRFDMIVHYFLFSGANNVSVAHIIFRNLSSFLPNVLYV